MTVTSASPVVRPDPPVGPAANRGIVSVLVPRRTHATATCSCGWAGRRRRLIAAAEQDAWLHAIHEHCIPSFPLLRPR